MIQSRGIGENNSKICQFPLSCQERGQGVRSSLLEINNSGRCIKKAAVSKVILSSLRRQGSLKKAEMFSRKRSFETAAIPVITTCAILPSSFVQYKSLPQGISGSTLCSLPLYCHSLYRSGYIHPLKMKQGIPCLPDWQNYT